MNAYKLPGSAPSKPIRYWHFLLLILFALNGICGISQAGKVQGAWSATINNDKVDIEFRMQGDNHNSSSNDNFLLSELSAIPKDQKGNFKITREAGSILFNGKFDGNDGSGLYEFHSDNSYAEYMNSKGVKELDDRDLFTYFLLNIKKDYVQVIHDNGFKGFTKNDLIALAALITF